jgi:hypothetical protein
MRRFGRCLRLGVPVVAALLGVLGSSTTAFAETKTFTPGSAEKTFEVPAGVTQVTVQAVGEAGEGSPCLLGGYGGSGASVTTTLHVSHGEKLTIDFAGGASGGSGSNYCPTGGGRGGDASTLLSGSSPLVVAGGGGGGGASYGEEGQAGSGGNAGATAADGSNGVEGGEGGEGGGASASMGGGSGGYASCSGGSNGELGRGGAGGAGYGEICEGGGGGGGGYYGGGGGGAGGESGGGGGAGSSFITPAALSSEPVTTGYAEPKVEISYTVPPSCTTASGRGMYKKRGEVGRLNLLDDVTTDLSEHQALQVSSETGAVRFRLVKLEEASCSGAAGERVFHGKGAGTKRGEKGYSLVFTIEEKAGGFLFESKLMKAEKEVEASGGPLKTSSERIS